MKKLLKTLIYSLFVCLSLASLQAQELSADGLVVHYSFDQNMNDQSQFNINGKIKKGAFCLDRNNKRDHAFHFDGKETYIDCGAAGRYIKDQMTLFAWVKTNSSSEQWILSKYNDEKNAGFQFKLKDGSLQLCGKDGNDNFIRTPRSRTKLNDNDWHCVVGVVEKNSWKIFVDGKQEGAHYTKHKEVNLNNDETLVIGQNLGVVEASEQYNFSGDIDEVAMYNRALNMQEIRKICPLKNLKTEEVDSRNVVIVTELEKKKAKRILKDLDIDQIKKGQTIKLKNLYFKADTSSINVESYPVLNELFDFLLINKKVVIEVGGHTNGIPAHDYCDRLSKERAKAVQNYLVEQGIKPDRLQYKGYGKRDPVADDKSLEGRKKNQRVEIKILDL